MARCPDWLRFSIIATLFKIIISILVAVRFGYILYVLITRIGTTAEYYIDWYIIAISIIGVALMGYDKLAAVEGQWRLQNLLLYAFALFGGYHGVLLAMWLFWHKMNQIDYWLVIVLAIVFDYLVIFKILSRSSL